MMVFPRIMFARGRFQPTRKWRTAPGHAPEAVLTSTLALPCRAFRAKPCFAPVKAGDSSGAGSSRLITATQLNLQCARLGQL
jgi:hypothetical protein